MVVRPIRLFSALLVLWPCAAVAAAQQEREAAPTEDPTAVAEPIHLSQLTDFQISAWLMLENEKQNLIRQFAQEHAQDQEVKEFAQRTREHHDELIAKLHRPLEPTAETEQEAEMDFGETLQQLAEELEKQRETPRKRRLLGFRDREARTAEQQAKRQGERQEERASSEPQSERPEEEEAEPQREERREARRERRPRSERRGEESRLTDEEREQLRSEREQLREEIRALRDARRELRKARAEVREDGRGVRDDEGEAGRKLLRAALPVLRENLPEILDVIGKAIEEEPEGQLDDHAVLGLIQFKRELAHRNAESIKEMLQEQEGADFDEAYLSFEILSHTELINGLELAKQHASEDFRPTLDNSLASMTEHLQRARELMEQAERRAGEQQ